MKKIKSILTAIAGLIFSLSLFNCGGSIPADVTPGTIGEPDPALIAAAASAKSVDPNNSKVLLYYWRSDASYSKWGLWMWEPVTNDGEPAYNATAGKATAVTENSIKLAYWDITTLTKGISVIIISFSGLLPVSDVSCNVDSLSFEFLYLLISALYSSVLRILSRSSSTSM